MKTSQATALRLNAYRGNTVQIERETTSYLRDKLCVDMDVMQNQFRLRNKAKDVLSKVDAPTSRIAIQSMQSYFQRLDAELFAKQVKRSGRTSKRVCKQIESSERAQIRALAGVYFRSKLQPELSAAGNHTRLAQKGEVLLWRLTSVHHADVRAALADTQLGLRGESPLAAAPEKNQEVLLDYAGNITGARGRY